MFIGEGVILENGECAVVKHIHGESVIYLVKDKDSASLTLVEGMINDNVKRFQSFPYRIIPVVCIPLKYDLTKEYGLYHERAEGYLNSPMEINGLELFGEQAKYEMYFSLKTLNQDVAVHYKEAKIIFPKVYQTPILNQGIILKAIKTDIPTGIQKNELYSVIDSNFDNSEVNDIIYIKNIKTDERTYSYIKLFKRVKQ